MCRFLRVEGSLRQHLSTPALQPASPLHHIPCDYHQMEQFLHPPLLTLMPRLLLLGALARIFLSTPRASPPGAFQRMVRDPVYSYLGQTEPFKSLPYSGLSLLLYTLSLEIWWSLRSSSSGQVTGQTWKILSLASGFTYAHLVSLPGKPCMSPQHPGPAAITHRPHWQPVVRVAPWGLAGHGQNLRIQGQEPPELAGLFHSSLGTSVISFVY